MRTAHGLVALSLACAGLSAQEAKVSAVVDVWYTQMLDHNLRLNTP